MKDMKLFSDLIIIGPESIFDRRCIDVSFM
jgi:hypothetical protein